MIGIIAAMDAEVNALVVLMKDIEEKEISHVKFVCGTLEGKKVVLMRSGVGKVCSAMSTTILLEHFSIDKIINIGTAGGLRKDQNILDIVVSDRIVQHDFDTSGVDGDEGIGAYFTSDTNLCKACETVLTKLEKRFHLGLIASGDQFIHSEEQLQHLYTVFPNAICAEMEAGAIAQVCTSYQVPFVILRSLSDIAHKEGSHMDFEQYMNHASVASALVCQTIVSYI